MMAGHVAPEAERGGPIALVRDGDVVRFDVSARRLDVEADLKARAREQKPHARRRRRRSGQVRRARFFGIGGRGDASAGRAPNSRRRPWAKAVAGTDPAAG
jgi:dihydroxy-acid dehydratase